MKKKESRKKKKKGVAASQEAPFVFQDVQYTDLTSFSENDKDDFDQKIVSKLKNLYKHIFYLPLLNILDLDHFLGAKYQTKHLIEKTL